MKTFQIPAHISIFDADDDRAARADKLRQEGVACCVRCSRKLASGSGFDIEIVDGGGALATPGEADVDDSGYMGFWSVGPGCAKWIPSEFKLARLHGEWK